VPNLLKPIYLRLAKIVVERFTVVKFGVDNRGSDDTGGYFSIKVRTDTTEFMHTFFTYLLTYLCKFLWQIFEIMISRGYNELSFREDLKVLYNRLGIENRKILFVFSDQHVVEDGTIAYTVLSPYRHVLTLCGTLLIPTSSVTSVNIMTYFS